MENKDNGQAPQPQEEVEEKVETQEKHEKKEKKHHHHYHHHHQPQPEKIHVSFLRLILLPQNSDLSSYQYRYLEFKNRRNFGLLPSR